MNRPVLFSQRSYFQNRTAPHSFLYFQIQSVRMSGGRIQCLLIASKTRHVVYERFYDVFSEAEKADIRSAFDETVSNTIIAENQEIVGRFKYVLNHL